MCSDSCIQRVFAALSKAYPYYIEKTLNTTAKVTEQIGMYRRFFADVPDDLLLMTVVSHVGSSKWWPAISEIRDGCGHLAEMANNTPNEFDAWAEIKLHLHAGHSKEPWSDPLIGKALDGIGGLQAFGQSDRDQEASWRARFYEAYKAMQSRERERRLMLPEVRSIVEQIAAGEVRQLEGERD